MSKEQAQGSGVGEEVPRITIEELYAELLRDRKARAAKMATLTESVVAMRETLEALTLKIQQARPPQHVPQPLNNLQQPPAVNNHPLPQQPQGGQPNNEELVDVAIQGHEFGFGEGLDGMPPMQVVEDLGTMRKNFADWESEKLSEKLREEKESQHECESIVLDEFIESKVSSESCAPLQSLETIASLESCEDVELVCSVRLVESVQSSLSIVPFESLHLCLSAFVVRGEERVMVHNHHVFYRFCVLTKEQVLLYALYPSRLLLLQVFVGLRHIMELLLKLFPFSITLLQFVDELS